MPLGGQEIPERERQPRFSAFSLVRLAARFDDHALGELLLNRHAGHGGAVCE